MHLPKSDSFLQQVLSYVKFPFDRSAIRAELQDHILDKIEYYTEQGYTMEEAEQLSVIDMGDAKEIGTELNRQHNPLLGWLWKITNTMVISFVILSIFIVGLPTVTSLFSRNPINRVSKSDIVYRIDLKKTVKIDDMVIRFTNVIYEKNGNMNILYEYCDTKLWGMGWGLGHIGNVTDNLGNKYQSWSGSETGGIKTKGIKTINSFSGEADTLIITYDIYNRSYKVEIPLKAGENNG